MNESFDELQQLAGEYVLGTLSIQRRQEVERRLAHEPALRDAIDAWEKRLLPLTALAEPQQPSMQLWRRIEQSLTPRRIQQAGGWQTWWNNLAFWRWLAAGGLAATALMAAIVVNQLVAPAKTSGFMVVLVAPQDLTPGWIVEASSTKQLKLIPLGQSNVPQQKALQFWTKGSDWKGPVSLGLVKPGQAQRVTLDQLPPLQQNQLFEITLEPSTGSLTGKPSGPVLFIGKAVKTT